MFCYRLKNYCNNFSFIEWVFVLFFNLKFRIPENLICLILSQTSMYRRVSYIKRSAVMFLSSGDIFKYGLTCSLHILSFLMSTCPFHLKAVISVCFTMPPSISTEHLRDVLVLWGILNIYFTIRLRTFLNSSFATKCGKNNMVLASVL